LTANFPPHSIAVVLGTRPEIVKLAHVIRILDDAALVIHSGQHYDDSLSQVFFEAFGLGRPHVTLEVGGSSRGAQIGEATRALDALFSSRLPKAVVVQGDTNTTVAGALAANANTVPLVHVEAGLRSYDRRMPEEHNRVLTDHLADLCCAPTETAVANLAAEAITGARVVETGNTVVEAVQELLGDAEQRDSGLERLGLERNEFVLTTLHRPENVDDPQRLAIILDELRSLPLPVVYPIHPRTAQTVKHNELSLEGITVMEPLDYITFLGLAADAAVIVSDSGGIQEEASIIKRPVVVVRRSTERPEVLGTFAELVEVGPEISGAVLSSLEDLDDTHTRLAGIPSPYGDGSASLRTVEAVTNLVG